MPAITSTGIHAGRCSGPTSVNMNSAASIASNATIGISAASSAGIRGAVSGAVRRSTAILVASPSCALSTLARDPKPATRMMLRAATVPPAARTQMLQAPLRATSETICSAAARPSTPIGAVSNAALNWARRPERTTASTPNTSTVPK